MTTNPVKIFFKSANTGELASWWDAVEAGDEWPPLCNICGEEIKRRQDSLEVYFRSDFGPGEHVDDFPDLGFSQHQECTRRGIKNRATIPVEKW